MLILNFGHRIKNDQLDKIKYLTGCNDINIILMFRLFWRSKACALTAPLAFRTGPCLC